MKLEIAEGNAPDLHGCLLKPEAFPASIYAAEERDSFKGGIASKHMSHVFEFGGAKRIYSQPQGGEIRWNGRRMAVN